MTLVSRPLTDNRMLRATGGVDLTVGLGSAAKAVFNTPQWTGLSLQSGELLQAGESAYTQEQQSVLLDAETQYNNQARQLERDITLTPPGQERDSMIEQLSGLKNQYNVTLSTEAQASIDAGRLQTPEDLQQEYGDLGLVFDRPMTGEEAKILAENKRAEIIRQAIIGAGPKGVLPTAALFGAGLASVAVDPLEVASMFIPVVGVGARARLVARFGKVGAGAIAGATEGLVGSALTEPFYYKLSKSQQLDYTMADALMNVGLGAVLGGGIGALGGRLSRGADNVPAGKETPAVAERIDVPEKIDGVPAERVDVVQPTMRPEAARVMLGQFVNDQPLDVSILTARPPKRPQTLLEFVRANGGINDNVTTFKGELANMGLNPAPRNNGANNPTSRLDLDDMAERAVEAGFIKDRDVGELLDAMRREVGGELRFSELDRIEAETWRDFHQTKTDVEAYQAEIDGIRKDIESLGVKGVTDSEIAAVSEMMATRGIELDDAWEQVSTRNVKQLRAEQLAENATKDPYADYEAARQYEDFTGDYADEFMESDIEMYDRIISQEELTPDQRIMMEEVKALEEKAVTYADVAKVAAACVART